MRIILFSSTYAPVIGGVETVTRRLASELRDRGHTVTVMTNRYPRALASKELLDELPVARRLFPNLLPSPGRRRSITVFKQILSLPLGAYEMVRLALFMKRFHPDVVNIHYFSYPAAYALLAARLTGQPVVLCFHGSDVPAVPYPATYGWAARWGCAMARRVICCSEDLRAYLLRDLSANQATKTSVSHYGIDGQSEAGIPTNIEGDFVLLPARLVKKKGVGIAIKAMAELQGAGVECRLVIIGSGPLESELHELARRVGVSGAVQFLGSIEHDNATAIMARSMFVLVPSYWEAFGMVCLEAMIAGKAVVGSNNGGITEIVVQGETGLLVPPGDPSRLAEAMRSLLCDPKRAEAMGVAGRERARMAFTWPAMLGRYEEAFNAAIGPV